jgi:two-component system, response regulator YesN
MINILIVDDDIATVEVIRDSIDWKKLNIDGVHTAFNVSAAKKILLGQKIDIIISDIEMPQETGLDLLKWLREEKIECEFLLLTCHENFSYVTNAIHFDAAEYLIKPFDINIMELNLQRIVTKLKQKRSLQKNSEYGVWMGKNFRFIKLDFWKAILEGELLNDGRIEIEIKNRHLDIRSGDKYCLIYTKLSNIAADIEKYDKSVFEFVLEGFHSEILTDKVENESVIKFYTADILCFNVICEVETQDKLIKKCERLIETCKCYFETTLTCCISNSYTIAELSNAKNKLKKIFDYNVECYGKTFLENEVEIPASNDIQIIDFEKIVAMVQMKDRVKILHYTKQVFNELSAYKKLNRHSLYLMKQEIVQVIYTDLMKRGIQATELFYDALSIKMADHAMDSTVDMIRWVNYLLEKTFEYEEEVAKSATIIGKINDYIHEHYAENIGRNEVAEEFYLTPEYIAKLYKKKTGNSLKDYINICRIDKAKELLKSGERNVSNIADMVGFDNYSYFSTVFKKSTGVSPKKYKNA